MDKPEDDKLADSRILADARQRLIIARKAVAPSQVAVARRLGLANSNQWTRYEVGERKPSLAVLVRFCDAYEVTLDFILRNVTDGLRPDLIPDLLALQATEGLPLASASSSRDRLSATPDQRSRAGKDQPSRKSGKVLA